MDGRNAVVPHVEHAQSLVRHKRMAPDATNAVVRDVDQLHVREIDEDVIDARQLVVPQ